MYSLLFLPTELTKNIVAGRVYNYIRDEDKQKERHVVAPYLLIELTRKSVAARVYNYIRDEDKQATAREQETEICFRFDIGELSWIACV